jgi:LPXTG-site transpeptidase (sortase) family protein
MSRRHVFTLVGSMAMLAGGVLIVLAAAGFFNSSSPRTLPEPVAFAPSPTPAPQLEPTEVPPTVVPTPPPSAAAIERILIPRIGIDAPIVILGVDPDGAMQAPSGPVDVAWYHFTARPGTGGNAVFAGHVDYRNYGPAVFWRLRELVQGDEVQVRLEDGTVYLYKVISAATYIADDAPVQEIVGNTPDEVVTLITCTGSFNSRTREYDKRLIVRAERVYEAALAQ